MMLHFEKQIVGFLWDWIPFHHQQMKPILLFSQDGEGLKETGRFYEVSPVCVEGVAHDMMLDWSWEKGAEEVLAWVNRFSKHIQVRWSENAIMNVRKHTCEPKCRMGCWFGPNDWIGLRMMKLVVLGLVWSILYRPSKAIKQTKILAWRGLCCRVGIVQYEFRLTCTVYFFFFF